jgi:hypothetical protein
MPTLSGSTNNQRIYTDSPANSKNVKIQNSSIIMLSLKNIRYIDIYIYEVWS